MDRNLLLQSFNRPGEIIQRIYVAEKKINSRYSIQYICSRSGISSKGYLSDVMKGRRSLKVSYARPLIKVLGLNRDQGKIFALLVELDKVKDLRERDQVFRKIESARKKLKIQTQSMVGGDFDPFIFCKAFCSLGVLGNEATLEGIAAVTHGELIEVQKALDALVAQGWLERSGEVYRLGATQEVRFAGGDSTEFHKKLIENSVKNALSNLDAEFENRAETYFESSTISVQFSKYKKVLEKLKVYIDDVQSELETDVGDRLVHFNMQILPEKA